MADDAPTDAEAAPSASAETPKAGDTSKAGAATSKPPSGDVLAVVDDARAGAAGMRSTAKWIAGALAGIPSVAILSTILKPPEDSTFEPGVLLIGLVAAVLGAVLGITQLARVFEPVLVEDEALVGSFRMGRITEAVDPTYSELLSRIRSDHTHAAKAATRSADSGVAAAGAEAELKAAEALFKRAEDALKGYEQEPAHLQFLADARARLSRASRASAEASGAAEAAARAKADAQAQLAASVGIRRVAFQLAAADAVKQRYRDALDTIWWAAALIAVGVGLVLLSTQIEDADEADTTTTAAPESISLVTLTLNDRGRTILGCRDTRKLTAIRLTQDKAAPTVITLPTPRCPARKVVFRVEKKPLGQLVERTVVQS
jgi:hypothetical protein